MSKEIATVKTYTYTVYTREGCEVTDTATGMPLITAEPGKPNYFSAMGDSVTVSDDAAIVFKPVFNSALAALGLLGEGDTLPAGYTQAYFLGSDGSANINTTYKSGPDTGLFCRSESTYGNRDAMGYTSQMSVPRPRFSSALPQSIGASWAGAQVELLRPLPKSVILNGWLNWKNSKIARAVSELGEQTAELAGEPAAGEITIFKANSSWNGRIYMAGVSEGNKVASMYIPAVDDAGKPCMYDTILQTPLYNTTSTPFVVGLTHAQLYTLLKRLPATGGSLTLSLPAEANTPEVAEALQACHDTKGWTLTVYEYRPAAAVTYSLRRVREVVWCRKNQDKNGSYVDAASNRWQVERCAAIFGRLGQDPSAYGFEPFDSVEQAAEHWQLVPYEDNEEENLNLE
jgi:hypothetical protein